MPVSVKVGFSTSRKLLSRLIRLVTKSKASHTWLLVTDSFLGVDMVLQATMGGFQMVSFDAFQKKHKIITIVDLAHPMDMGVKEAAQWLGFRYDYLGLLGELFVEFGRWFKRKLKNPLNDPKAMFCSEAVVRVLQASSYPGSETLDASATSPQDLLDFLLSKNVTVAVPVGAG